MKEIEILIGKMLAICEQRGWKRDWQSGGVYLHLEASEFIESLRGKGTSTPAEEAGDVLFVLLTMCKANNIDFYDIVIELEKKLKGLEEE